MTPNEIKKKEFKKMMWGYAPREVAEYLDQVAKALDKAGRTERELNDKIKSLNEDLTRWKNKEIEMAKLREKAVHDADAIRIEATQQAEKIFLEVEERANEIRKKTEEWLENVIAEVEETERQKMNFMTAFRAALDSHYAILKTETEEVEPLGMKLNNFLKGTMQPPSQRAQ